MADVHSVIHAIKSCTFAPEINKSPNGNNTPAVSIQERQLHHTCLGYYVRDPLRSRLRDLKVVGMGEAVVKQLHAIVCTNWGWKRRMRRRNTGSRERKN